MNCAELQPLINAWVDGELAVEQQAGLREHLSGCDECAALAEDIRETNAELAATFAGPAARLAQHPLRIDPARINGTAEPGAAPSTLSTMPANTAPANTAPVNTAPVNTAPANTAPVNEADTGITQSQPASSNGPAVSRSSVVSWICALAAALLILAFSWQSPNGGGSVGTARAASPAARLIVATGDVQAMTPMDQTLIACAPQTELPTGWRVVTGENSRCELTTSSPDQAIRLDQNTEVAHVNDNTLRLEKGRVWSSGKDFCLESPSGNIAAKNATFDFSCAADNNNTLINVYEGEVDVTKPDGAAIQVKAGQSVRFGNWGMQSTEMVDPVLDSSWLNDILVRKGTEDQELVKRIEWLWSQVQNSDPAQAAAYETEIRALGSCTVGPLCNWVQSPLSLSTPSKRAMAAKLLSDLAGPDAIPRLIDLLNDDDGDVRYYAAVALERLTGKTQGRTPDEWRALPSTIRQKARGQWNNWLNDKTKDGAP